MYGGKKEKKIKIQISNNLREFVEFGGSMLSKFIFISVFWRFRIAFTLLGQ